MCAMYCTRGQSAQFPLVGGGGGEGGKFQSEFLALKLYIRPQVDFSLDAFRLRRNRWGEVQKRGWVFTC